jgi:C1A family cysteine protease
MKFPKLASVEKLMFLIAAFIALFALIPVSTACNCTDFNMDSGSRIGMANPAAVYCEELGYEYKIITDNESGQRGVCVFPDNTSCDAWGFFTGKCGQNYSYCKIHGCEIETVSDGKSPYSPEYAVCVLPNKTTKPVTKLMDLDEKISAGSIPIEYKSKNVSGISRENNYFLAVNPTTFDWRIKDGENWMTPVRDQGYCGSCWAFAAVGGVEPKINIARNDSDFDVNLAEQYLVSDCCENCGDCNGGLSTSALGFIKTQGISDEPCFPYIASDCPCSYRCSAWNKRLWKIDDYDYVPSGRENMKSYLIEKGPLVVSMCMNGHFDANGIYRCDGPPGSYHAVVIVGYDDVEDCWIAKNSWGSGWNGDGYFKVGFGECLIENYPRYVDLTKEQTEDFKADDIQVYTGSKTGELNDTYYKDGDYVTLAEKCYTISCDGLDATINLSVETLQNITSIDLIAYHRARWEGGFSLYYWDENSDQWVSLGSIPDSTWHLMKYKLCDSESECASYLSSGNVSVKYYHPSCSFCNTDYVDIDWLYLEAYPEKTYCPASTNNADYEWINRVALNTGERISGSSTYSDFTDEVLTTLNRGDTYTLQVDGHTTGGYKEFVKAWIDFNNDKDFIDAGEEIELGNYTFNGNHTFSANFKVPEDAVLSDTRMRVYLKYGDEPSPCENASYGEVEDYKIKISSAAVLTDNYFDYGIDIDEPPNGFYDYLAIDVGVNVTELGYYWIGGDLFDEVGSYVDSAWNSTHLDSGNHSVTLKFSGIDIRENGVNGTFNLKHLSIRDDSYDELDYRYDAYTTYYYNYTDFEPLPALFASGFNDYGEDTNSNALYDYLVIEKEINVLKAGDYRVSGWLYAPNGTSVDYDSNYTTLSAGLHNVTLKFRGWDIYKTGENGNFDVSMYLYYYPPESAAQATTVPEKITVDSQYIPIQESIEEKEIAFEIYEEGLENKTLEETGLGSSLLDWMENTTSYYSHTEFESPPAEFNDQNSDFGEDTDGDGLYNYLVVGVGVNVTEAGDYRARGYLYDNTGHQIDYESNTTYLSAGNQIVQLKFEGIKIRQNEVNGTFDLKSLYLYDSSTGDQLDYRYDAYTTTYYNYTDFQIPPAEFNDVYSDYGEDTDGDGLYDHLVVDVGVNVTEAGDYRVSGDLYENGTYNYVDYDSNTTYLEVGNQTVQLRFDAWEITKSGTFDLKYLGLYNATYPYPTPTPVPTATPTPAIPRGSKSKALESVPVGYGEQLDYRYYAYTTGYYEPLPRPALLNDVYSDEGEDTNNPQDGLYDYLVVEVGVNVTEVGNYRISGELYETGTYNFVDSNSTTAYLDIGNQTVPLRFEGVKIWNNEYNGTYDLKYLRLYDANYPVPTPTPPPALPRESESKATERIPVGYGEQLDYRYYAYTTSYYNYTEFEESIPDAYEPDDNPLLANYISVDGTKQTHDFHIPGDHDWLKFNATKGNSYTIETSELGDESDTYLYLYDTDGTTEIDHDDDSGSGIGLASKIAWNCSISGTYYVMVRHFSSSAFGPETRYNISVTVKEAIFDTGSSSNPYPSIMGNHTGTIKPNHTVIATKLYTYPCIGTGGHTEYAEIRNATWNATATWEGYIGDWHNITFDKTVVLLANETYNYTIHTGSYPQIIHETPFNATGGTITCDKFIDANGRVYYDWIPAIKFFC